jgi:uncharacterized membrane protein YesL
MENKLTEKEIKFLNKLYKNYKKLFYHYIGIGILFCLSITGLVLGLKFQSKDGFLMAIYFGTISFILLIKTRFDKKVTIIIKKLESQN